MSTDDPIALEAYEELAEAYAAMAETKAENGYNEHPAIRAQIGDPSGLDVLDAGCGPGFLVCDMLAGGAKRVVGFDISPKMIALAKKKAGPKAELFIANLAGPLGPLEDESFDLVTSSLAIDYVRDWSVPLSEFARVLRPGGRLVFSVQHPMGAYEWYRPPSAFGVQLCEATWRGFTLKPVVVPDFYRSMEEIIMPVLHAGFTLTHLRETKPDPELAAINPHKFARGSVFPTFMVLEGRKAGS